jgi:hypothetical protein
MTTGYSVTSGGFSSALAELRTLQLIEGFRATDDFMQGVKGE